MGHVFIPDVLQKQIKFYLSADSSRQLKDVQADVKKRLKEKIRLESYSCVCWYIVIITTIQHNIIYIMYFAEIGVEVNHAVAELFHILSQQLISIGYPVIQVSHLIVGVSSVNY